MKKLLFVGCIILFVCCGAKRQTVETEGLEEVIAFEEGEPVNVSDEPVLPQPIEEKPADLTEEKPEEPPLVEEEEIVVLTEEELVELPPIEEEVAVAPLPVEEEITVPIPVLEEIPPPIAEEPYIPAVETPTKPAAVFGFRIQVFASSTEKSASRVADDARSQFSENVYVQHVVPYYKIRIGDCLTREEAMALKNKALRLGYSGAFIVETTISP